MTRRPTRAHAAQRRPNRAHRHSFPPSPHENDSEAVLREYPLVPLRDTVVCPFMVMPVVVGRQPSLRAIELALQRDKQIFLAIQRNFEDEEPGPNDLFESGCLCRIMQTLRQQDGTIKILVEGIAWCRVELCEQREGTLFAVITPVRMTASWKPQEAEAVMRATARLFEEYVGKNPKLHDETVHLTSGVREPLKLFYLVTGQLTCAPEEKVALLDQRSLPNAYRELCRVLSREIDLLNLEHRIYNEVRQQIDEQQKTYFLHEQIKVIERELGRRGRDEISVYEEKLQQAGMPPAVLEIARSELQRLEKMPPFSPEGTVVRNYLDWLLAVPWQQRTEDNLDIDHARRILDDTHYGLKEPKERLLEYLAVRRLRAEHANTRETLSHDHSTHLRDAASTVLCLVGPPGVGKTSLARAIADALGRRFVRIALGGVRDEAEIRGHRRTYIGALPGRIIQALKKAGTRNPVMLLDEVDKIYSDVRGDPAAALLEVLDPEQNHAFNDHYLEVDVDLSEVIFICTANVADAIHPTLRDRMEKIELSSYTEAEKLAIARQFLIEKQRRANAIPAQVQLDDDALRLIIREYTHEAGVRELERQLAQIMRKLAMEMVTQTSQARMMVRTIPPADVRRFLGTPKHHPDATLPPPVPGMAIGLAWTESGGELLKVEVAVLEGKGDIILTGQLGDVMQESARAAVSYVRARRTLLGLPRTFFARHDLHIHVPEGAIPKDGPSAGITIAVALYSALAKVPTRPALAMTGEITLNGAVLVVGGLKEKLVAAHRAGVAEVIIPQRNAVDLEDIPPEVRNALQIHLVQMMDDVIALAFDQPVARRGRRS
ncbi:MAG: endopeptidase La [bacterium]|nr:endopeptidase La [bacterium]